MVIDCMYVVQVHPFPSSWLTNDLEGWEGGSRCYVVETNTPLLYVIQEVRHSSRSSLICELPRKFSWIFPGFPPQKDAHCYLVEN